MKDYAPSVIVETRAGAGGRVAVEALKGSTPDGSAFLLTPVALMSLYPHVYKSLRYDPFRDFVPVTTVAAASTLTTIGPKVPDNVTTLADFIAWCRANPQLATFGSPGAGSPPHFTGVKLARAAGFEYIHVPYLGNAPAAQDLLGGQIASSILTIDGTLQNILAGRMRALATTSARRSVFLPDVPTIGEAGYPALETVDLWGTFVPAQTPSKIVGKLSQSLQEAAISNEVKGGLAKLGIEIAVTSLGDFNRLIKDDFEYWRAEVRSSGFTPQN
jgi:tripartite-type tricarboxylate transporter receptor subunit TctC